MCHVSLGTFYDMVLSRLVCRMVDIADNVMVSLVIIMCYVSLGTFYGMMSRLVCRIVGVAGALTLFPVNIMCYVSLQSLYYNVLCFSCITMCFYVTSV